MHTYHTYIESEQVESIIFLEYIFQTIRDIVYKHIIAGNKKIKDRYIKDRYIKDKGMYYQYLNGTKKGCELLASLSYSFGQFHLNSNYN